MTRPAAGRGTGRRRRRRRARGLGTATAVAAVGLIALSGPATEVAADVVASRTAVRPPAPAPAPGTAAPVSVPVVPEPLTSAPGATVAIPRPGPVDLEVRPPYVPVGVVPEFEPRPAPCGGYSNPRRISPGVAPGPVPGSATLSWLADARPSVEGYRVRAVSQQLVAGEQPVPPEAAVAQPVGCVPVSVTVTGLVPGGTYVFWLEEDVRDDLALRRVHVGTTAPVVVS